MKRLVYLATAALLAMMILVPTAMAQEQKEETMMIEETMMMETTTPLPKSGGPVLGSPSILLPAAALLLGTGVLTFAVLRRR